MFGINLKIYAGLALVFMMTVGGGYLEIHHLHNKLDTAQTQLISIKQSYQDDQDLITKLQNDKKTLQQSIAQSQTTIDHLESNSQQQIQTIEKTNLDKYSCSELFDWMKTEAKQ